MDSLSKDVTRKKSDSRYLRIPWRIAELYNQGGIARLDRGVRDFLYYQVWKKTPFHTEPLYHEKRIDNHDRWEFIESYFDQEDETLLDIGCADGFFTMKAVEYGLNSIAIDVEKDRIKTTRQRLPDNSKATVVLKYLDPENIEDLPSTDVTLLLTVHHHWVRHFGRKNATKMLKSIASKTDLLIYEPPGDQFLSEDQEIKPEESIEMYTEFLTETFADAISIRGVEMFDYRDSSPNTRSDPVFVIDTAGYSV